MTVPKESPEAEIPIANPRFLLNHLDMVDIVTTYIGLIPIDKRRLYVINSCHEESVWLVSNKLRPVNIPDNRIIILGPYLSSAHPLRMQNKALITI